VTVPAYKVATVFDISQTEGRDLPQIAVDLKNDVEGYSRFMDVLKDVSPVPIEEHHIEGETHGYYHLEDKKICIKKGMSQQQTLKTAIHEIAHAVLHDKDSGTERENMPDIHTKEVEAESVAYTVCKHFGIDSSDYSFGYVAGWSKGRELEELKDSMNVIRKTASDLITSIEKRLYPTKEMDPEKTAEPVLVSEQMIGKTEPGTVVQKTRARGRCR
jgi:Zn-dependent peptidase ImmA (M78 family)